MSLAYLESWKKFGGIVLRWIFNNLNISSLWSYILDIKPLHLFSNPIGVQILMLFKKKRYYIFYYFKEWAPHSEDREILLVTFWNTRHPCRLWGYSWVQLSDRSTHSIRERVHDS
jgi:hypothetical protein